MSNDTSVKVAVRIRPLSEEELSQDSSQCVNVVPGESQIVAGNDTYFSFDYVFGSDTGQATIYDECVTDLVNAAFEGFNATILAYGQTGSGKTFTMGSSSDVKMTAECIGIIPRVIKNLFDMVREKEQTDPNSTYKILVQFLEIYGEDIRDLLDQTKTSKVSIRETPEGEVFVSGAKEELVTSFEQMMKTLEDGTRHRTTASTKMNQTSSRSHAIFTVFLEHTIHTSALLDANNTPVPTNNQNKDDETIDNIDTMNDVSERSSPRDMISSSPAPATATLQSRPSMQQLKPSEVRKCKFHFVDLAGSERAKRTGAQGQQLKEGIDINKGLLALGNVISALGDEQKRGKVFVPYRDSKLTRMLQDSLGGNSKTLMICCVSPASTNFNESVNALRYANRARNIQNKPVVNRDPTLIIIDELKQLLKVVSSELLLMKRKRQYIEIDGGVSIDLLENLSNSANSAAIQTFKSDGITTTTTTSSSSASYKRSAITENSNTSSGTPAKQIVNNVRSSVTSTTTTSSSSATSRLNHERTLKELNELKNRLTDADFEIQRLTSQLKTLRLETSENSEQILLLKSERDFYKMKWAEVSPEEAKQLEALTLEDDLLNKSLSNSTDAVLNSNSNNNNNNNVSALGKGLLDEKKQVVKIVSNHLREIDSLKKQLANEKIANSSSHNLTKLASNSGTIIGNAPSTEVLTSMDEEFSKNIATLIAQTREHLQQESKKLQDSLRNNNTNTGNNSNNNNGDESDEEKTTTIVENASELAVHDDIAEEQAYIRRQHLLSTEVADLGQSIQLKEQLVVQLTKSQQQYGVMKAFYEHKLVALGNEMREKEVERERLVNELQDLTDQQVKNDIKLDREKKLREELKHRDEELKLLKKKQDELSQLSQVQSRYTSQLSKLEQDITAMKKQRVDLTKTLQNEKKNHMIDLSNKAKEIERLKRELTKSVNEVKKLGRDKELAENKAQLAMKEGAALRKKTQELMKSGVNPDSAAASARAALRAMNKASKLSPTSSRRILSEEELRMKKWLDKRIIEISAREQAADTLKKQYETQLELLNRKESLELERNNLNLTKFGSKPSSGTSSNAESSTLESKQTPTNNNSHNTSYHNLYLLSSTDEEKVLEIEEQLATVNGQLDLKTQQISDIHRQIANAGDIQNSDKTIEVLKRSAAGSLPAAHELIRLLFDMLVNSSKNMQTKHDHILELNEHETAMKAEIEDLYANLAAEKRSHDIALTKLANEYEEKLQGLFNNIAALGGAFNHAPPPTTSARRSLGGGTPRHSSSYYGSNSMNVEEEDEVVTNDIDLTYSKSVAGTNDHASSSSSFLYTPDKYSNNNHSSSVYSPRNSMGTNNMSSNALTSNGTPTSLDPTKLQLAISTEETKFLRSQLQRQTLKTTQLQAKYSELEKVKLKLQREIDEKTIQIKFLEEDRSLFKEMADDLKLGLNGLGKPGKNILDSVKDRALNKRNIGNIKGSGLLFSAYTEIMSDDDGDDESESVLGEFDYLADEINRTGGHTSYSSKSNISVNTSGFNNNNNNPNYLSNSSDSASQQPTPNKAVVYDRLTNPSNFTGHMKNVFEQDIETKRKKIQQIRNHERKDHTSNNSSNSGGGANNNVNTNTATGGTSGNTSHGYTSSSSSRRENNAPTPVNNSNANNYAVNATYYSSGSTSTKDNRRDSSSGRHSTGNSGNYEHLSSSATVGTSSTSANNTTSASTAAMNYEQISKKNQESHRFFNEFYDHLDPNEPDSKSYTSFSNTSDNLFDMPPPAPNVFSRLATKFTGMHKHRNTADELSISSSSSNASTMNISVASTPINNSNSHYRSGSPQYNNSVYSYDPKLTVNTGNVNVSSSSHSSKGLNSKRSPIVSSSSGNNSHHHVNSNVNNSNNSNNNSNNNYFAAGGANSNNSSGNNLKESIQQQQQQQQSDESNNSGKYNSSNNNNNNVNTVRNEEY